MVVHRTLTSYLICTLSASYTITANPTTSYMEPESYFITKTQCQPRYNESASEYHVLCISLFYMDTPSSVFQVTYFPGCLQKYYVYITFILYQGMENTLVSLMSHRSQNTTNNLPHSKIFPLMKNVRFENGLHKCHHLHL